MRRGQLAAFRNWEMIQRSYQIGQVIHCKIQLVCDHSSWLASPHHELVELALAKRAPFTVILHIRSMEFHELHGIFRDVCLLVDELLHQRVPQKIGLLFDDFYLATLCQFRSWWPSRRCNMYDM